MQAIGKALWFIEAHFDEPLRLDDVAAAAGLSRFYLSRTFVAAVGMSVLAYVRGRRLTQAAYQLADGAPDILQVALAAGYSSHEAFTRAFRDQFGLTPEEVRARRSLANLNLVEAIRMPDASVPVLAPERIFETKPMLFAGLRRYFTFADRAGIPTMWQAFGPMIGAIPGEISGAAYGINLATADQDDENGFDYLAAVEVRSLDEIPEGLSGVRIPARRWAAFRHAAHVSSIGSTCAAAGEWLAQSGRPSAVGPMQMLEVYGPHFDARTGLGGCEVWVPAG